MKNKSAADTLISLQARKRIIALVLLAVSVLLLAGWIFKLIPQWQSAGLPMRELPVALRAASTADYSADKIRYSLPGVSLSVLLDVLRDLDPGAGDLDARLAAVYQQLQTPLPTLAGRETSPTVLEIVTGIPTGGSASVTPPATGTLPSLRTATSPPVLPTFQIPEPTLTEIVVPATPVRTATPVTPTANTPEPTTITPTDPVTGTETAVTDPTLTEVPTAIPGGCSAPDPVNGYVLSITPQNDAVDVLVGIQPVILFNQPMDPIPLIYGNDRLINLEICESQLCSVRGSVEGTISIATTTYQNDQVVIIPAAPLQPNTYYLITVGNQIRNHPDCGSTNQGLRVYSTFRTESLP
jgi:hypothetical protein